MQNIVWHWTVLVCNTQSCAWRHCGLIMASRKCNNKRKGIGGLKSSTKPSVEEEEEGEKKTKSEQRFCMSREWLTSFSLIIYFMMMSG